MFHRLFDGHSGINLYPVDISVLYAYFPCFTENVKLTFTELRDRLKHVIKRSLEFQDINYQKDEFYINSFIEEVNKRISDDKLRNKNIILKAIKDAWVNNSDLKNHSLPFVFKETSQAVFFKDFKESFPDLKMISLIRDPRDNYAAIKAGVIDYYSKMDEDAKSSLASVINRARMDLQAAEINQKSYPDSFLAIKFEDLLNSPEPVMKKITSFLNIEFNSALLTPTINGNPYKGNNFDGKKFSGISNFNLGRWKDRILKEEAMIIEYWLKDVMEFWDYNCEYDVCESQKEFSKFYSWYNCKYFYHDSFQTK
jgi:hypothetical protein